MVLLSSTTHQLHVRIERHGTYVVPRCATYLFVPFLNHKRIRWTFIGYNGRRQRGTAGYLAYLETALNEVSIFTKNNFGAVSFARHEQRRLSFGAV